MKKILSLLVALIMVMSLFNGVTVSAAEGDSENLISGLTPTAESVLPTSFAYLSDTNPANLTDGVIRTDSDSYKGNYTFNPETNQIISFAYEKKMSFKEINVATCNPSDLPVKGIKSLKAEALIDGDWFALASVDNLASDQPGQIYAFTSDTAIEADGIRISMTVNRTGTGYNTISLSEIQVFADVVTENALAEMVLNSSKMEKPQVSIKNGNAVTAKANSALTLEALASVTDGGTLSYQWYKNGVLVSGQTRSILTFVSVSASDAGTYKVVATNSGAHNPSTESAEVTLTVNGETENLALGAPYTWENYEGSVIQNNSNYMDSNLKEMTDGYISQNVSYSDAGYTASNGGDLTFVIDLLGIKEVEAVTAFLMSSNSAGITMPTEVTVSYSTNRSSFTELGVWTQNNTALAGIYAATVTASKPVSARYIKVSVDGAGGLHFMSEATVYGTSSGAIEEPSEDATNIALGRPYTSSMLAGQWYNSNTTDNNYRLTNGVYGSLSSYNNANWAGWLNAQSVALEMDLGAVAKIYEVNTRNFNTEMHGIASAGGYEVYSSIDGVTWNCQYVNNAMHGKEWLNYKASASFDARFIRIVVSQGNSPFIFLDEIEVIGVGGKTLPAEPDANTSAVLSAGKAYSIVATDVSGNEIENTTDSQFTLVTDSDKNGLASFDGAKEVTVTLNLGSVKAVESINMYTKNLPSAKIYLADSAVNGKINWVIIDTVNKADSYTYTFQNSYKAQFVKLVFTAGSGAGIYEIEVVGKGNTNGAVSPTDGLLEKLDKLSDGMKYTSSTSLSNMPDSGYKLTNGNTSDFVGYDHLSGVTRYAKFDLNGIYEVNAFEAVFSGSYLPSNIQIMVSEDNKNWTLVNEVSSGITATNGTYKSEYILGEGIRAQYVMFSFYKASGTTALSEVSIYGIGDKIADGITEDSRNYMIPTGTVAGGVAVVDAVSGIKFVDKIVEAGFDGVVVHGSTYDTTLFLDALDEKATSKITVGCVVSNLSSKYENLVNGNCRSTVISNIDEAGKYGWGVEIELDADFEDIIFFMNEMVEKDAQGRYVHKLANLDFDIVEKFPAEELDKIFENLGKLNKGTLKASGSDVPETAELALFGDDWASLAPIDGYEYSTDGKDWGKDPTFPGLTKGQTYTLYQRIAETAVKEGSVYDKIFVTAGVGEVDNPADAPEEYIPGAFDFNMYEVMPGEEFKMTFVMPETVVASSLSVKVEFNNDVFEIVEIPETPWSDMQPYLEGCNANANVAISWCDPTFDANTTIEEGTLLLEVIFRAKEGVSLGYKSFVVSDWNVTGKFNEETFEPESVTPDAGPLSRKIKIVKEKSSAQVSGNVKAFGGASDNVTIELLKGTEVVSTATVTGKTGTYTFKDVTAGEYTVRASKTKHATRDYVLTVGNQNVTQDVEIWLYGDVTGDGLINSTDVMQMNRKATNMTSVFSQAANQDYRLKVANVSAITGADTLVNNTDIMQINRKISNQTSIIDIAQ